MFICKDIHASRVECIITRCWRSVWQGHALDIKLFLLHPTQLKCSSSSLPPTDSARPLSLCWGTGGHLPPLTPGPSEQLLLSAPPLLLPVPGLMPLIYSRLACSHPPDGNDFQMEQGSFELVTQKVEGFIAHCLPSGPNICELALFRIRLQALENTHTALSGGLVFSHFSQPSKPSTIMSHSNCSPKHSLHYANTQGVQFWTSACHLVSQAPLQFLSCFPFMSWGKSS